MLSSLIDFMLGFINKNLIKFEHFFLIIFALNDEGVLSVGLENGFHFGIFIDFMVIFELGANPDGDKEFFFVVINHKWLLY